MFPFPCLLKRSGDGGLRVRRVSIFLLVKPLSLPLSLPSLSYLAVETVGSVYVVSAGAPEPCSPGVDPAALLCEVALRCRDAVAAFTALGQPVQAQMGMHVGPIVGKSIGFRVIGPTNNGQGLYVRRHWSICLYPSCPKCFD